MGINEKVLRRAGDWKCLVAHGRRLNKERKLAETRDYKSVCKKQRHWRREEENEA